MSSGDVSMPNTNNRGQGNKRLACSLFGCKRVYTDKTSLQNHIKDHELPAQSVPGKIMMCSMIGCGGSFPNMQKLMEHLRHHHKPNVYFLCESCHAKLRSYRGLLHHLRSCSKAPKPKLPPASTPSVPMEVDPVKPADPPQENLSHPQPPPPQPQQLPSVLTPSNQPPLPPQSSNPPLVPPNQDQTPPNMIQHIIESTVNALFSKDNPQHLPNPEMQSGVNPTEGQIQQTPKTPENSEPLKLFPAATVWKPGQGVTPEKRILWQHTRGRYRCVQCGHTVTNRKEMTDHSTFHSNSLGATEETNGAPTPTPPTSTSLSTV